MTNDVRAAAERIINPRLWGEWEPAFFGSGTTLVRLKEYDHKPYIYVYASVGLDDDRSQSDRYPMCQQIADYMNGGDAPRWLDDFIRIGDATAKSLCGGQIFAVGPSIDNDPPNLNWVQDDSDQAVYDRAKLMDVLFGITSLTEPTT